MIILKLRCGLGNQLFEYAFARSLMHKLGEDRIYLDLDAFDNEPSGRENALKNFSIPEDTIVLSGMKYYLYRARHAIIQRISRFYSQRKIIDANTRVLLFGVYNWNFEMIDSIYRGKVHYLQGIFQNYHYFEDIREELLGYYQLQEASINKKNLEMIHSIESTEAVCVHIRRGDYVSSQFWSKQLLICNEYYYVKGIEYIRNKIPQAKFFVFSNSHDDILWIKENYSFPVEVTYVDLSNSDIEDFRLMRKCKHFVMSNSSYSWWAQYLADYQQGIVVAPSYWDTKKQHYSGIYMDKWIEIDPLE